MNLQTINPPAPEFVAVCLTCGKRGESPALVADLDGEPFKAYHHGYCVNTCPACGVTHPNGFVRKFGNLPLECRSCGAAIDCRRF